MMRFAVMLMASGILYLFYDYVNLRLENTAIKEEMKRQAYQTAKYNEQYDQRKQQIAMKYSEVVSKESCEKNISGANDLISTFYRLRNEK